MIAPTNDYIVIGDFFFLELHRRAACYFIKVEIKYTSLVRPYSSTKTPQTHTHLTKTGAPQNIPMSTRQNSLPYSPKAGSLTNSSWSFLAPALHQGLPSALTALRTSWMLGVIFSNTHELQLFHCNTSHAKLLIWPSSTRGTSLHMRSTSLTLSSSLRVKGLTRRCYVWNANAYKLALTLLNFQRW
jgi:hypothetical protein